MQRVETSTFWNGRSVRNYGVATMAVRPDHWVSTACRAVVENRKRLRIPLSAQAGYRSGGTCQEVDVPSGDSSHDWFVRPAWSLAADTRSGAIDPVALVQAHIERVEAVNPSINALVADRFTAARRDARRLRELAPAKRGPLHGLPISIKEFLSVKGMPRTGGLASRAHQTAEDDGTVAARLQAAGAVVLGVSNVPEGGLWMETYNTIWGRTRNPWDLGRTSGGSSGGEGALVASGAVAFGMGSDVGGSIRIPAAFCGVAGHKPTGGLVPNTGHFPPASPRAGRFLCTGPLARTVADLRLAMSVISGPDGRDAACTRTWVSGSGTAMGALNRADLTGVRVVPLPSNGWTSIRSVMRNAVDEATRALVDRGAEVVHADLPRFRKAFGIWSAMLSEASDERYDVILGDGTPISPARELFAMLTGRSQHSFAGLVLTLGDRLAGAVPSLARSLVQEGMALQEELEAVLGPNGVLLHPPYSRPAPRHGDAWRTAFDASCTAIFNVLESPVTVVRTSFESRGLPVGVQVVGIRGADALTLDVAELLERDLGGFVQAEPA
ncbi:MAG: amidase [Deltaproteobacteria bacterium]|nr:amidase [Deltaproteobacteria bacterium]